MLIWITTNPFYWDRCLKVTVAFLRYNYVQCYKCLQWVCVLAYRMFLAFSSDMADLVFLSPNTTRNTRISLWYGGRLPSRLARIRNLELDLSLGLCVSVCLPVDTFQPSAVRIQKRTDLWECISLVALANIVLIIHSTFLPGTIYARGHMKQTWMLANKLKLHNPTVHTNISVVIVNSKGGDGVS